MLVRFLPFFDKKINWTFITDIDLSEDAANLICTHLDNILNKNIKVCYLYLVAYSYRYPPRFINKKINNVILAQLCSKNKYDIQILNKFINDSMQNKYKEIFDLIYSKRTQAKKDHYPFLYGVDEFFLNEYILPIDINNKDTYFLMLRDFEIGFCLRKLITMIGKNNLTPDIEEILAKIKTVSCTAEFYSNSEYFEIIRNYILDNYSMDKNNPYYKNILLQEKYYNSLNDVVDYSKVKLSYIQTHDLQKYFK
jgi:hypothetical protein